MSYTKYSHDDKVLIQHYREKWNYGARKIIAEFPDKGWTESGVKRILKKIDEEGSIERRRAVDDRERHVQRKILMKSNNVF